MRHVLFLYAALLTAGTVYSKGVKPQTFSTAHATVNVYTTRQSDSVPMHYQGEQRFADYVQPTEKEICIFVNPDIRYQRLLGIGGAITDASAEVFARMPADKQQKLLRSYYDKKEGIAYSLLRTTIQSSDFASGSYSYLADHDSTLRSFSISHDMQYRIPLIRRAIQTAGGAITTYASPWSPPAWMKSNQTMLHGGSLLPRYHQLWANCYVRFVQAYQKAGIPLWGLSVQNEPMAVQTWESCIFTGKQEAAYIKNYLGPTLARNGLGKLKLIAWDHNRDLIFQRATDLYSDPQAAKYIWGLGFHWYETWSKCAPQYDNIQRVHEAYPQKNLMFTEGCIENFKYSQLRDWWLGERYGDQIMHDFNNGACGWTDWNILLDEQGGPNHAGNYCFAPVHYNTSTGELIYDNAFYYIGHFSRYLVPGARRVACSSSRSCLQATSFMNPDGKLVTVVMNLSEQDYPCLLWINGRAATVQIPAHSISTLLTK